LLLIGRLRPWPSGQALQQGLYSVWQETGFGPYTRPHHPGRDSHL
jgi:hypothetical protein